MLFTSPTFLFFFLPLTLAFYFLTPWRNAALLTLSLVFYAWGEPYFVILLVAVIVLNFQLGLRISDAKTLPVRQRWLTAGIAINILVLVVFKYLDFLIGVLNTVLAKFHLGPLPLSHIPLPLGVSFFTFQAISYLMDIHRGHVEVERSLFRLALFKANFPQLIAGPIVRYGEMSPDLSNRKVRLAEITDGFELFLIGLAKKVLIADTLAVPSDRLMHLPVDQLSAPAAWIGVICFSLQIYFDFSGYTDMARGLGRVFGFHFPENFQHPYAAKSIQEFWRRWHMTLSRWFRDYVYIPLGGNRGAVWKTSLNLWLVFCLCGFWHGASWTFLIWGLWHGAFLVLERTPFGKGLAACPRVVRHLYVIVVVGMGWVFFRSTSLDQAMQYLHQMWLGGGWLASGDAVLQSLNYFQLSALVVGIIAALPVAPRLTRWVESLTPGHRLATEVARSVWFIAITAATFGAIAATTLQSFIYFRF
ncbi:MAG: MBOAT family O-acyltransferase [Terrimicrobiaceae bacterium]